MSPTQSAQWKAFTKLRVNQKWQELYAADDRLANTRSHIHRHCHNIKYAKYSSLQSETLIPFRTGGVVGLRSAPWFPLCCHLHINGSPKEAFLPLDFGTGNWQNKGQKGIRVCFRATFVFKSLIHKCWNLKTRRFALQAAAAGVLVTERWVLGCWV